MLDVFDRSVALKINRCLSSSSSRLYYWIPNARRKGGAQEQAKGVKFEILPDKDKSLHFQVQTV